MLIIREVPKALLVHCLLQYLTQVYILFEENDASKTLEHTMGTAKDALDNRFRQIIVLWLVFKAKPTLGRYLTRPLDSTSFYG